MYNFLQFKNSKDWIFEVSPFLDVHYKRFIHLIPNEWYLQRIDIDEDITEVSLFNCENKNCIQYKILIDDQGRKYINFKISYDGGLDEYQRLVINGKYSNYFIVTDQEKEFTSLIHYKDNIETCNCQDDEIYYQNIRLKIIYLDKEDGDNAEEYFEISTGNTRLSRVLEKEFDIFEIHADNHVNSAFKRAYNSNYFYINKQRYSKKSAFNRERRIEASNIQVTEFAVNRMNEEIPKTAYNNSYFELPTEVINKTLSFDSSINNVISFTSDYYEGLKIIKDYYLGNTTIVNERIVLTYSSTDLTEDKKDYLSIIILNECGDVIKKIHFNISFKDVVNKAPIANAGTDQNITLPINKVNLSGSLSSDNDGTIVSYVWSVTGGTLNNNSLINPLWTLPNIAGTYTATLIVTDNDGATSTDTMVVTVKSEIIIPPTIYKNFKRSKQFTRDNCAPGEVGSTKTYTVLADTYQSTISQADANQKAIDDINANGQNWVNANAVCNMINTLFNVTKVSGSNGTFKIETSRFINTLTFKLKYRIRNGSNISFEETQVSLNNDYDFNNLIDRNNFKNDLLVKDDIVSVVIDWVIVGGVYSIVFKGEPLFNSGGTITLIGVENVSAT